MARPTLYPTDSARKEARRLAMRARPQAVRLPLPEAPLLCQMPALEPPVDAVVALFDAAARRVAEETFKAQVRASKAEPAFAAQERASLYRLAIAMRAAFMGEAEVLLKRCL